MVDKLMMTVVILILTAALLDMNESPRETNPPRNPPPDPTGDQQKIKEVKIAIHRPVEPAPTPRPAPLRHKQPEAVEPPPLPPLESPTFVPGALDYLKGDRLPEGGFPRLSATYRLGFPAYRDAVLALGAEFFLWDGRENRPIAQINIRTGETSVTSISPRLSRWPRDVTKHLKKTLDRGRAEFGTRVTHIVLLPPSRLDAAMLSGLKHLLRENGIESDSISGFYIAFEMRGERLHCVVLSASFKDGGERPVSFAIDLGGAYL